MVCSVWPIERGQITKAEATLEVIAFSLAFIMISDLLLEISCICR
jgi:hypothetical protein